MTLVERARYGAAADAAQAEVVRLLTEEVDHDKVMVEFDLCGTQAADCLDGAEHTDDAVVAAAAVNGVGMRTGHDRAGQRTRAGQAAD